MNGVPGQSERDQFCDDEQVQLPRTNFGNFDVAIPDEAEATVARKGELLKKRVELACRQIDRHTRRAEKYIGKPGGSDVLKDTQNGVDDTYEDLRKFANGLSDLLDGVDATESILDFQDETKECVLTVKDTISAALSTESERAMNAKADVRATGTLLLGEDHRMFQPSRRHQLGYYRRSPPNMIR